MMIWIKCYTLLFFLICLNSVGYTVKIEKRLLYDRHTLHDTYKYGKQERRFQWDKISAFLDSLMVFQAKNDGYGVLRNYKNVNGIPPLSRIVLREFLYIDGEILACRNVMDGMGLMLP